MALPLSFGRYVEAVPLTLSTRAYLTGKQLTALQMYARGYSYEQIEALMGVDVGAVAEVIGTASRALGAPDVCAGVWAARARGLIV